MPRTKTQTKFPRDIWLLIFDHFRHHATPTDHNFLWSSHRADPPTDLLSLRLVCKTLKYWIDPLLFPVMYVKLESRSLRRFEELSKIPSIAKGVHGVCVDVGVYRPSFGESAGEFWGPAQEWMMELVRGWMFDRREDEATGNSDEGVQSGVGSVIQGEDDGEEEVEGEDERENNVEQEEESGSEWSEDEDDSEDDSEEDLGHSDCRIERAWLKVISTLDRYVSWTEWGRYGELEMDAAEEGICKLFDSCQEEYRYRCKDQQRIVGDNSFVNNLAVGICRLGRPITLALTDRESFSFNDYVIHDQALEYLEQDGIGRVLVRTSAWFCKHQQFSDRENRTSDLECVPTGLLLDIPIACERVGSPLSGLAIDCSPAVNQFVRMFEYRADWADLGRACHGLRTLNISLRDTFGDVTLLITGVSTAQIQNFLVTVSSGPRLEALKLSMGVALPQGFSYMAVDLGPVVKSWNFSTLSELRMITVRMASEDLELVIGNLTPKIKTFLLRECELSNGTYAKALSMLRHWVRETRRGTRGSPTVALEWLRGGEFGGSGVSRTKKMWKLGTKAMAYVESQDDLPNPLEQYGF